MQGPQIYNQDEYIHAQLTKLSEYEASGLSPEEVQRFVSTDKGTLSLKLLLTEGKLEKTVLKLEELMKKLNLYEENFNNVGV